MNKNKYMIVGLTGGIGSGKTTVSDYFASLGIEIVDADVIAREVVKPKTPALNKIIDYFGSTILLANGELNRQQLRSEIFKNDKSKTWLNNLLHPIIRKAMQQAIEHCTGPYCLFVAPLLLENKLQCMVDRILVVDISPEEQIKRTTTRDNNNADEIQRIINSQISRAERLNAAHDVIDNSTENLASLYQQVDQLHKKYLKLAQLPHK